MAEAVTVARPYAEAIYRLAREGKSISAWSASLQNLSLIAQNSGVQDLIGNPQLSAAFLAQFFSQLVLELEQQNTAVEDGKNSSAATETNREFIQHCEQLHNIIATLAQNWRLGLLPQIAELFELQRSADANLQDAVIESAFDINTPQLTALLAQLESHFKSKLKATVVINPLLIGGVRVHVGDRVLDTSVQGKLLSMSQNLKH